VLPTAPKRKRRPVISGQACAFGGKDSVKENRQGCLSRFIRAQTGPLRRLSAPQCTKKKKTPKGVFFFLVRKMGLEPTRHGHTHLKRACLPIPALPHSALLLYHLIPCCQDGFLANSIKNKDKI
jgi:hypothetical protein